MRILMLGGTGFVGRHITEAALARGHQLTLFNRGQTNAGLFAGAETRTGDRQSGDLASLHEGEWDAVVDVNAYFPRVVREAIGTLAGRIGRYVYISTCSVYVAREATPPLTEESPLVDPPADETTEEVTGETYGGLKVLCERVVLDEFGDQATVIRPGIVAGPHDPTDRFTYWVRRFSRGGEVLLPNRPEQPVQVVHARDQAEFVVDVIEKDTAGVFNTVGPSEPLTFASLASACADAGGVSASLEWVDESFLADEGANLPLWLPSGMGVDALFQVSPAKAIAAGLRNRPITETAADTLAWDQTRDQDATLAVGLSAERERELLKAWRDRN